MPQLVDEVAPPADGRPPMSPQSVGRVIGILEALCARAEPVTLADLSRALDSPKSSLVGLLRGLEKAGLLVPEGTAWRLGAGAFGLGSALVEARRRVQSSDIVREGLQRLAELSGETVLFAVADTVADTLTYVDIVESRNPLRFTVELGDRRPLYCTAAGRALLAAMPEDAWRQYLKRLKPVKLTAATVIDKRQLAEVIAQASEAGVATTVDQAAVGVGGAAAVIRDAAGAVLGALTIGAPSNRLGESPHDLVAAVRDEARAISRNLGYRA